MNGGAGAGAGASGTSGAGGLSSATGLPAPNAGRVGSAPTRDPRRRQGDVIHVTKNAAWKAGVRAGMVNRLKTALNMQKMAYQTPSDRDGPQTRGELGVENSSSETTGMNDSGGHRSKRKITRGPGNQGPRGAPEWLRGTKFLRSPGTWNGGAKSGPQDTDNQFETPGAGGRP